MIFFFFFQAEDGIRDYKVTGVQTCALPISMLGRDIVGRRWADQWDSPTLPEKRGVQITKLGEAAFELGRLERGDAAPEPLGAPVIRTGRARDIEWWEAHVTGSPPNLESEGPK